MFFSCHAHCVQGVCKRCLATRQFSNLIISSLPKESTQRCQLASKPFTHHLAIVEQPKAQAAAATWRAWCSKQ
jgi:hypothetical protein